MDIELLSVWGGNIPEAWNNLRPRLARYTAQGWRVRDIQTHSFEEWGEVVVVLEREAVIAREREEASA